jgi:antibiotic biosynthesis monooxygenase (ABM) superfamily enzyme
MKKKKASPEPFVALTKDSRFEGTYEVLVPVEGRVRPYRVGLRFETQESAEAWIHSQDGKEAIAEVRGGKTG